MIDSILEGKHFALPEDGGLCMDCIPDDILHQYDKIYTCMYGVAHEASMAVADQLQAAIKEHQAKEGDRPFRLGLTTGVTPNILYQILSQRCAAGELSFGNVEIYSIDEYYPCTSDQQQSRNYRLHQLLLDNIDVKEENVHIPDGTVPMSEISDYCARMDASARELDMLIMGVGENGQVGFNEAGASHHSRTRVVLLPYQSRKRQAKNFNGNIQHAPKSAITLGIDTMMSAKRVILMAWGEKKADAVASIVEGEISAACPASYFQSHGNVTLYVDDTAGSQLTRVVAPWKIGPCNWTERLKRKAVVWLCTQVGKPILKLSQKDYLENSLSELIEVCGTYDAINIQVFNDLQHTITGWPGGKPNADDSQRPVSSAPYPKTVLVLSPHPDDDVISMGGTLIRLTHQGHNVHVAYQTSGDVAVHDDVVMQHMDAAKQLGFEDRTAQVAAIIAGKVPGEAEPRELLHIKGAIRRSEARGACRSFGLPMENVHFLDLPFYESGGVTKLPCTQADVDIIKALMQQVQPHQIYMAGDLADPHGTHRVCTEAALKAFAELYRQGEQWTRECHIWLYRGAWMEWEIERVDMAVPLSPDEVIEKRHAIYHHLSQKDIVPFPGDDPREFWQRAEERTSNTAALYDSLGMAEYQAMEVFLKLL